MRKLVLAFTLIATVAVYGTATPSSLTSLVSNPLVTQLMSGLGLNPTQATGGAGALLGLAQKNLAKADWKKLSGVIPGASSLISEAKSLGGIKKFTNLAGLSSAFTKMGLNADQVSKLTPAMSDFVTKAGGADLGKAFTAAIK